MLSSRITLKTFIFSILILIAYLLVLEYQYKIHCPKFSAKMREQGLLLALSHFKTGRYVFQKSIRIIPLIRQPRVGRWMVQGYFVVCATVGDSRSSLPPSLLN